MKHLATILLLICAIVPNLGLACSMYKLTKNGKTIVGNNEDFLSPNNQFWFEKGNTNTFGVMYMGQLDNFAQGAINEKGLVFDGFWEPYLEVKNTAGKLNIPIQDALKNIMQTMTHVEEVRTYLSTVNLSVLHDGQLVFVDQSGTYLIIEGDEMFIGDESEKTFSNFYYSQIQSVDDVALPYFQKGQDFIKRTKQLQTLDYCSEAMSNFAQNRVAPTQYTTIYDLETLTVRVHLFHDFSDYIELDLKEELQKENYSTMIADLFPDHAKGVLHYKKYNNPEHPTLLLEELIGDNKITEQEFVAQGFDNIIHQIGYEWLYDIKKPKAAIRVFKYGLKLMPNNAKLYDSLGKVFYLSDDWDNATISYAKSLALNPKNKNAIEMITKISKQLEQPTN
ncbi:MAG: hypothetical protein OIF50_15025 [Flavobacteriaceae bacterium]|nr:hypothetical protein [Flavobacteriaceae bacterium]